MAYVAKTKKKLAKGNYFNLNTPCALLMTESKQKFSVE